MLVRYNALNRVDKPLMTLCNPGCHRTAVSGATRGVVGPITDTEAEEIIYNFNAPSELNFRMNRIVVEDDNLDSQRNTVFNGLANRRLIYVEDIGFFSITSVKMGYRDGYYYKDVTAQSIEVELQQKGVPPIEDGTYYLFTQNNHKGILDIVVEVLQPQFSINATYYAALTTVDSCQKEVERCQRLIQEYGQLREYVNAEGGTTPHSAEFIANVGKYNDAIVQDGGVAIEVDTKANMLADITVQAALAGSALEQANYELANAKEHEAAIRAQIATDTTVSTSAYPAWTVRYIDSSLAGKMRTFEDVDPSLDCLTFLTENLQEAFECIFIFDPEYRMIDVYDQNSYMKATNIQLSIYDFVDSMEVSENADELFTALNVRARDDTGIGSVNPLGTNVIYNFEYYKPWMSSSLRTAISNWEAGLADTDPSQHGIGHYLSVNKAYYGILTEYSNLNSEIEKDKLLLQLYNRLRDNIVAESGISTLNKYNEAIVVNGGNAIPAGSIQQMLAAVDAQITAVNSALSSAESDLADAESREASYRSEIAFDNLYNGFTNQSHYFTADQIDELRNFIFEGTYTDEYTTITEDMSYDEQFEQMEALYKRGVEQLARVSRPIPEYTVDTQSSIFTKEFEQWSDELETGRFIDVLYRRTDSADEIATLFLSTITVNYDEQTMSLKFSGRLNRSDPKALYQKVLGQISKSASSVNFINNAIAPVKEGQFDDMRDQIEGSRNITMQEAFASDNEEIVIDGSGLTGKMYDPNTGTYDPRQIKITSQSIVFTEDSWANATTAVGRFLWRDTPLYGINGEAIIGNLIIGENLFLKNNDNTITFDDGGLNIQNSRNSIRILPGDDNGSLLTITDYLREEDLLRLENDGGLYINPSAVQIAFNNSNQNIKLETNSFGEAQLNIYQSYDDEYHYQKLVSFDQYGSHFFDPNTNVEAGRIGVSSFSGGTAYFRGVSFDIDYTGSFMAWAAQTTEGGSYTPMFTYMSRTLDPTSGDFQKGFHFHDRVYVQSEASRVDFHTPLYMFNNNIYDTTIVNSSDVRLKKNIKEYAGDALSLIDSIKLNSFDWIETDKHEDIGFIAQQLRDVVPDAVHEDDKTGRLYIKPMQLIPYLVGAVQELYRFVSKDNKRTE